MHPRDPDWLERVLGAEDLTPEGRTALEEFFQAHPQARRLADRIHRLESRGAPRGEIRLPHGGHGVEWRAAREHEEARESLRRLVLRLGLSPEALPSEAETGARAPVRGGRDSGWRRWFPAPLWVPAAVGALAILFLKTEPDPATFPGASVRPAVPPASGTPRADPPEVRGPDASSSGGERTAPPAGARSPGARVDAGTAPGGVISIHRRNGARGGVEAPESWSTGDPFVLRFLAPRDGALVLVHVDPRGAVALLDPADPHQPARIVRGGERIELPGEGSTEEWVFDGAGGVETFLLATGDPASWSTRDAILEALSSAPSSETPEEAVLRVRRALQRGGSAVHELRVDHRPAEASAP